MHSDFLRKWNSLQQWSYWDLFRRINTQLFPLIVCSHFFFTQNLISSLLLILGLIFNSFNFIIRHARTSPPVDPVDPIYTLRYKERSVFLYAFWMCSFFLFLKLLLMTTIWFNYTQNLSAEVHDLVMEIRRFCFRITPFWISSEDSCQKDTILLGIFIVYLGLTYLFNRRPSISFNHFTLRINLVFLNKYVSGLILLGLVAILFGKSLYLFKPSVISFLEVYLLMYSIVAYWFSLHRKSPKSRVKFINYFKLFSTLRLLQFVVFLNIKKIGNSSFPLELLSLLAPELAPSQFNYEIGIQLCVYILSGVYCWCFKFRAHFSRVLEVRLKKNLSRKSHFIRYFASNMISIAQIDPDDISQDFVIGRPFFRAFASSKHFLRAFRREARLNSAKSQQQMTMLGQTLFGLKGLCRDFYSARFLLARLVVLGVWVGWLAIHSFSINLFSVLNYSMILVIVLFPRITPICNSAFVLLVLPHFFFMLVYTSLLFFHYSDLLPQSIYFFFSRMLTLFGMETAPDQFLPSFFVHFTVAFVTSLSLLVLRFLFKNNRTQNNLFSRSSVLFFCYDHFILALQTVILLSILTETLRFPNLCNFVILLALYWHLISSRRSARVVAITLLLVFTVRFFSRYKLIFGFFENTSNLLFGLYYNIQQVHLLSIFVPSPENVYFFNLSRMLVLVLTSHHLSSPVSKPVRFRNPFVVSCVSIFKNVLALLDSTKVFYIYFSVFFLALFSLHLSILDYLEICYASFLLLLHMILFKSREKSSASFFVFFFAIYFGYSCFILGFQYIKLLPLSMDQKLEDNFLLLFPPTIKLCLSTISLKTLVGKLFYRGPGMVSVIDSKSTYYFTMRLVSVFLREVLLFYTLLRFLPTPNLFKVIYLSSYLFYFCYQLSELSLTLQSFQLRKVIMSKLYYTLVCLVRNLHSETPVPDIPNALFRKAFPHIQILFSRLFSRAVFNSLYGVIKKTWLMLFLSLLVYLQALFFLSVYLPDCKSRDICRFVYNLNFDNPKAVHEELFQVILVLLITVSELYFVNILRLKKMPGESNLSRCVSNLCIGFFKFRATSANPTLQDDLKTRFLQKHSQIVQSCFSTFRSFLESDISVKVREFAEMPNQLFLQLQCYRQ